MSEFVVNPDTGRVVRKNGKAYKRWRRAHPQEPEPPIVDSQRKKVTRPSRRPPIYPNMDHAINPPRPTDTRPWLSTQHHPPPTTGAEDWHGCHLCSYRGPPTKMVGPSKPFAQPPMRRRVGGFGGEGSHHGGWTNCWSSRPPYPSPPPYMSSTDVSRDGSPGMNHDTDDDNDRVIHQLLQDQGPDLLQAYEDPNVDFMQALSDAYQRNGSTQGKPFSRERERERDTMFYSLDVFFFDDFFCDHVSVLVIP